MFTSVSTWRIVEVSVWDAAASEIRSLYAPNLWVLYNLTWASDSNFFSTEIPLEKGPKKRHVHTSYKTMNCSHLCSSKGESHRPLNLKAVPVSTNRRRWRRRPTGSKGRDAAEPSHREIKNNNCVRSEDPQSDCQRKNYWGRHAAAGSEQQDVRSRSATVRATDEVKSTLMSNLMP